jgi:sigma-E factor negative regulatory protein RseA
MQVKDFENQDVALESVSALMDGEASELDVRRVVKAAAQSPATMATWQRYHLVRASLHGDVHSRPAVNLLAGIHEQLAGEAVGESLGANNASGMSQRFGGVLRRIGQGAIAASVAMTALYSASYLQVADEAATAGNPAIAADVQQDQMPSLGGDFTPSELSRTVSMDMAARKRLQRAVYQSSALQTQPLGEPYVFPETDAVVPPALTVEAVEHSAE